MLAWQATQRDPGDFDAVYNHGLALQELASRITASGADQMRLLTQARCLPAPVPDPYDGCVYPAEYWTKGNAADPRQPPATPVLSRMQTWSRRRWPGGCARAATVRFVHVFAKTLGTYAGPRVQACERYEAAWRLREGSHAALYNWGVALSDMSRAVKQSDRAAAHGYLLAAAGKYATSLRWNPNNPQVGRVACQAAAGLLFCRRACDRLRMSARWYHGWAASVRH